MSSVGTVLSEIRRRHNLSQQALAMMAEVSPRHISFIETGRSQPSRAMLLRLSDVLGMSLQDSNLLLHSGGFAAAYSALDINSAAMRPVREALQMILDNHNPYPALVMDGNWNVLMSNTAQQALANSVATSADGPPSRNILELVFHPQGFRPYISNWEEVAGHLLRRLRRQVQAYDRPPLRHLMSRLLAMDPPADWQQPSQSHEGPMLSVHLLSPAGELRLFSTLAQFGTALDVGMEELMIESYFPVDQATRDYFVTALVSN